MKRLIVLTAFLLTLFSCAPKQFPIDQRIDEMNSQACLQALSFGIPLTKHDIDLCKKLTNDPQVKKDLEALQGRKIQNETQGRD